VDLAPASLLIITFIVFQVTLGALTVLSRRQPWINSLHVLGGAVVLTTSLVITLWSWRCRIAHREG
jgi:heme A synthase